YENGWIGFYWSDCKFKILNLQICGVLDKKAAVEQLRKKLRIPKGSGASKKPVEEEEVEEVGDI
ncbi:MAG TPA: hypothetical protein VK116_01600, partial [Planctomycetota bacterium]|nr:hypothetical protein [Planctomycetota bacterium]